MLHSAVSDQGLHCLPLSQKWDARHKRVKNLEFTFNHYISAYEPRHEKTCLRGLRPVNTKTATATR